MIIRSEENQFLQYMHCTDDKQTCHIGSLKTQRKRAQSLPLISQQTDITESEILLTHGNTYAATLLSKMK